VLFAALGTAWDLVATQLPFVVALQVKEHLMARYYTTKVRPLGSHTNKREEAAAALNCPISVVGN
jgi:hypothetical protein